ncbi:MAG: thioredoxin family protein [Syntrophobacterales bacterium]|nr:thioredoxin family protein [Syntrophobacterales bacterium]
MGTVTYPKEEVARFVDLNFIPVQIEVSHTALMQKYGVSWTPTLLVLDADGKEHYRSVGFLPPEALIATLAVAKGRYYLDLEQYPEARAMFEEVIAAGAVPEAVAEAIFFNAVAQYKETHNPKPLRQAYETLTARYPGSDWAKRAEPYRLIPA